jgi:GSH-dependent disulfide-bond oxidoreductase
MLTLYTWTTPNGRKIPIMLEELGLPYTVKAINIMQGEQQTPEYLEISPNNKIPALVDDDADGGRLTIFESGAILTYLAEKTGRFLPASGHARYKTLEWLYWQVGGIGPMFGQIGYFCVFSPEKIPQAIERFTKEGERLLGVMERKLATSPYLAGEEYTIADMATYPWVQAGSTLLKDVFAESFAAKPGVTDWLARVGERPAVQRGMAILQPST